MDEMNITSARYYQYDGSNACIEAVIDGETIMVTIDAVGNRHYDEIMRQVEAGTLTIQDAD